LAAVDNVPAYALLDAQPLHGPLPVGEDARAVGRVVVLYHVRVPPPRGRRGDQILRGNHPELVEEALVEERIRFGRRHELALEGRALEVRLEVDADVPRDRADLLLDAVELVRGRVLLLEVRLLLRRERGSVLLEPAVDGLLLDVERDVPPLVEER